MDPGASFGWAISVLETAEPRSSFIVAPFVLGGATAVLAERTGSVAPERPLGRRVGTGGPGGLASSVVRPGHGNVVPLTLRRFVAHAKSPVLGGLFRPRPSGFGPGAGVAGASPLLTSPVLRGPMAATGGQTCYQGYQTPLVPAASEDVLAS